MNDPSPIQTPVSETPPRGALAAGALAAVLASACCVGPLVLILLGLSGAWIGHLVALEPYRPWFVAVALIALALAWRRLWRPAIACAPGQLCATPRANRAYKLVFLLVVVLVVIALGFPLAAPLLY